MIRIRLRPAGINPADARQSTPQGGATYDGTPTSNSGVMSSATGDTGRLPPFVHMQKQYMLTFPATSPPTLRIVR